jgi:hypothetical protein
MRGEPPGDIETKECSTGNQGRTVERFETARAVTPREVTRPVGMTIVPGGRRAVCGTVVV